MFTGPVGRVVEGDYMSAFDPGNVLDVYKGFKNLVTGKAKKKQREAKRKARGTGKVRSVLDELAAQRAEGAVENIGLLRRAAEQQERLSELQRNIASGRQTLEQRANLYGGFFA